MSGVNIPPQPLDDYQATIARMTAGAAPVPPRPHDPRLMMPLQVLPPRVKAGTNVTINWDTEGDPTINATATGGGSTIVGNHALLSATHTDTDPAAPAKGDLIRAVEVTTNVVKWQRIPIGAQDQVLTVDANLLPAWAAPATPAPSQADNAIAISFIEWIRVTQNTAKLYVDQRDWRGRGILAHGYCFRDTVANARAEQWTNSQAYQPYFEGDGGWTIPANDQGLMGLRTNVGDTLLTLYMERNTGKLYVSTDGSFVNELQTYFWILGGPVKAGPGVTI